MSTQSRASKVYTRTGDKGKTSLIGGSRVSKADLRLESYGTVDELNCVIGILIRELLSDFEKTEKAISLNHTLLPSLREIQSDLFNVGSQLACEDEKIRSQMPNVSAAGISQLETQMDQFSLELAPLKHFILPGGARSAAVAHLARTVCRRAERLSVRLAEGIDEELREQSPSTAAVTEKQMVLAEIDPVVIRYLNRLSDYFFVLSRWINASLGVDEPIWESKVQS